jgi:hypothetical protein
MIASALIIGISVLLLGYWFRYSCILLLQGEAPGTVPADGRFRYPEVLERLRESGQLDPLHSALDRDYRIVTYLLNHAAGAKGGFEERLLVLDYQLMQFWYRLTRTAAPRQARKALLEMASVVAVLGCRIGTLPRVQNEA